MEMLYRGKPIRCYSKLVNIGFEYISGDLDFYDFKIFI